MHKVFQLKTGLIISCLEHLLIQDGYYYSIPDGFVGHQIGVYTAVEDISFDLRDIICSWINDTET